MNKLAVLAFSLLIFFSTMLWYLANGSLNDYLKSQVLLQSHYYSGQKSQLVSADFSNATGITQLTDFSLSNIDGLKQPLLFKVDKITVQLAATPTQQLDAPSIQKKTTTLVNVQEIRFNKIQVWSQTTQDGKNNLESLFNNISTRLAIDYPALYPKISAKLYANKYPERSEKLALESSGNSSKVQNIEINEAVIASNEAKQKKRLLGKAQTRVKVTSVVIDELTLTMFKDNKELTKHFQNINLNSIGKENGLDSNQLGGELLKQLLNELIKLEKANTL